MGNTNSQKYRQINNNNVYRNANFTHTNYKFLLDEYFTNLHIDPITDNEININILKNIYSKLSKDSYTIFEPACCNIKINEKLLSLFPHPFTAFINTHGNNIITHKYSLHNNTISITKNNTLVIDNTSPSDITTSRLVIINLMNIDNLQCEYNIVQSLIKNIKSQNNKYTNNYILYIVKYNNDKIHENSYLTSIKNNHFKNILEHTEYIGTNTILTQLYKYTPLDEEYFDL